MSLEVFKWARALTYTVLGKQVPAVIVVGSDGLPTGGSGGGSGGGSSGSTGKDFSANKPAVPVVGAAFAAGGPFGSYLLVKTVAANPTRAAIEIANLTGDQIAVVRDDGTAANAAAPVEATPFALAGGAGAGQQGGTWGSKTFKGRLQIYAPVALAGNAFVSVMED